MHLPQDFVLGPTEVAFHFDTNNTIDARRLGSFIAAISAEISRAPEFGPQTKAVVRSVTTNSPTTTTLEIIATTASIVALADFVNRLEFDSLRLTRPAWLRRLAEVMEDDGVPVAQALTADPMGGLPVPIDFVRERMPAVAELRMARMPANDIPGMTQIGASAFDPEATRRGDGGNVGRRRVRAEKEVDYLGTEDGDPIVTNLGERIAISSKDRKLMPGTTGRAVLVEPGVVVPDGLGRNLGLMGRFVQVAGSSGIVFESGDEVFEVVGGSRKSEIPLGQNVTVTAAISWSEPGTIIISGWAFGERKPKT